MQKFLRWVLFLSICFSTNPSFSKNLLRKKKRALKARENKFLMSQRNKILGYALRNNWNFKVSKTAIKSAKVALKGAKVFPNNPVISVGGGAQFPANTTILSQSPTLPRVNFDLSLALPIGGRWGKKQNLASAELKLSRYQTKSQSFYLSLRIHRALNQLAITSKLVRKRLEIVYFFKNLEIFTKKRIKHGTATQLDLQLLQTSLVEAKQSLQKTKLRYNLMKQRLKILVGWSSPKKIPWKLDFIPNFPALPKKIKLISNGLQKHVLIQVAKSNLEQLKAKVGLAKARSVPDLTISFGYSLEDNNHVVGGRLSIPLPIFWRNQSKVRQAQVQIYRAGLFLARQRFLVRQNITLAYHRYKTNLRILQLFKKQLKKVQSRSRLLEKGLRQGSFSVFQVLATQKNILRSQIIYLQNIQKTHDSYIQLCHVAGFPPTYKGFLDPCTNKESRKCFKK